MGMFGVLPKRAKEEDVMQRKLPKTGHSAFSAGKGGTPEGRRGRTGSFTLVEMLVVISVIAILSSLLLPALGKAKGAAKAIACSGNLKQIGVQFAMYADDNNGWVPLMGCYDHCALLAGMQCLGFATGVDFTKAIAGGIYPKTIKGLYLCPNAQPLDGVNFYKSSYTMSCHDITTTVMSPSGGGCFDWNSPLGAPTYRKFTNITPNSVIMLEGLLRNINWGGTNIFGAAGVTFTPALTNSWYSSLGTSAMYNAAGYANHDKTANFLFMDGHTASYKAGTQFGDNWELK